MVHEGGHDTIGNFDTERMRGDVNLKEEVLCLLRSVIEWHREDGGQDSGSVRNGRSFDLLGSFPLKKLEMNFTIFRVRVEPPTTTMSRTFDLSILESQTSFTTA